MTSRSPSRMRRNAAALALASALCLTGGAVALGSSASAALIDVPVTGAQGRLVLSAAPYPAEFLDLTPGDRAYWYVDARVQDATRASLQLELRKSGDLVAHPRGLTMLVDSCDQPWSSPDTVPVCAAGAERITVRTPANDDSASSPVFELDALTPDEPEHLLVTLGVEDSAAAAADGTLMGLTGDMALGLTAVAVDGVPVPDSPGGATLPATGMSLGTLPAVAALAAGLLGLGFALRLVRKAAR